MNQRSLYIAQIRFGWVEIYRDDSSRVDAFKVPSGIRLRPVLVAHGWRPTGYGIAGRGWDVILVERMRRSDGDPRRRRQRTPRDPE